MQIFAPRELEPGECRAALIPDTVARLVKLGAEVVVESGLGEGSGHDDAAYAEAGATVTQERQAALRAAEMVLRLRKPPADEVALLNKGCIHISYLDPFNEPALVDALADAGVTAISMEMIPRTTLAQKMDALSSQANLAGYTAVVVAAERLNMVFPMMMTPAGRIGPARVFVIGAGVAGLQAIATAKRLGARVEAFDTRPVVEEQVKSLGARFIKVNLGETGQTKQGYAKELTDEQREKQQAAMAKACAQSDVVITTAQLFGRKAPLIITDEIVRSMKPGSVIVDLAVETGGNVAGSKLDEEMLVDGVRIVGLGNLPGRTAVHASQMYSANIENLVKEFWDEETKAFQLNLDDEILHGCVITHDGALVNETIRNLRNG
ncbi:MAG: Re/Si-specific NAD(P)(+) transhydrogenase subunit alpha [Nitrospiraceae bacterium]|nr:Re/Si-specific NAD(P)(+) transhydrogenase subunit alpha [Nitrospiraceae bacterium]